MTQPQEHAAAGELDLDRPGEDQLMIDEPIPELGHPALGGTPSAGALARIEAPAAPGEPQPFNVLGVVPRNLTEIMALAEHFAASDLVPKSYQGRPANVVIAWQHGRELGLNPMQSLLSIEVINGRPALWGDALPALAQTDPRYQYMQESWDVETQTAVCTVKRYGEPAHTEMFSMSDAERAGLTTPRGERGEISLYVKYPRRMCGIRARSWALRNKFPGRFRGLPIVEEIIDLPPDQWKDETPPPPRIPAPLPSTAGTGSGSRGSAGAGPGKATAKQVGLIKGKLEQKSIDRKLFTDHFAIGAIEDLPFARVNEGLAWIQEFKA